MVQNQELIKKFSCRKCRGGRCRKPVSVKFGEVDLKNKHSITVGRLN